MTFIRKSQAHATPGICQNFTKKGDLDAMVKMPCRQLTWLSMVWTCASLLVKKIYIFQLNPNPCIWPSSERNKVFDSSKTLATSLIGHLLTPKRYPTSLSLLYLAKRGSTCPAAAAMRKASMGNVLGKSSTLQKDESCKLWQNAK